MLQIVRIIKDIVSLNATRLYSLRYIYTSIIASVLSAARAFNLGLLISLVTVIANDFIMHIYLLVDELSMLYYC